MFHHLHRQGSFPSGQGSITDKEFESILGYIGIENILSADEWLHKLTHNKLNPYDVCITFDDGLKCQYEICLPILEKYNIKAFWFIYSSVFEGKLEKNALCNYLRTTYFNSSDEFFEVFFNKCEKSLLNQLNGYQFKTHVLKEQILRPFYSINDLKFRFIRNKLLSKKRFESIVDEIMEDKNLVAAQVARNLWLSNLELKVLSLKGHYIGLHSYNHPFQFSELPYKEQVSQYARNYNHIKKTCNKEVISMSHPLNSYNKVTLKILSQLNIICGFRANMVPPVGKKINPSCLEMAREDPRNILNSERFQKL